MQHHQTACVWSRTRRPYRFFSRLLRTARGAEMVTDATVTICRTSARPSSGLRSLQASPIENTSESSDGLYFVAANEVTTYAELGRRAGKAAGQARVQVVRIPSWVSFIGAALSELWARIRDQSQILNRDKWREATAGDWVCSTARIREELGWAPAADLDTRLRTTARAYAEAGVLRLGEHLDSDSRGADVAD